jgi:hypothetical protein
MIVKTGSSQQVLRKISQRGIRTMKAIALILALAFAAPLAAHASPSVAQVVEQTYHTSFPAAK